MRRFLVLSSLFLVLFSVVFIPNIELIKLGEYVVPLEDPEVLLGTAFEDAAYFKYKVRKASGMEKSNTWAFGSSRALQFQEGMFNDSFFNMGYTVASIHHFKEVLEIVPRDKWPNNMIVSIDPWMFNERWANFNQSPHTVNSLYKLPKPSTLWKDWRNGKLEKGKSSYFTLYGSNAHRNLKGIRQDGSFFYGDIYYGRLTGNKPLIGRDYQFRNTLERISLESDRFVGAEHISETAKKELEDFLDVCDSAGITVYMYVAPFATKVIEALKSGNHNYITEFKEYLHDLSKSRDLVFKDHTFTIYDDSKFIDGFHAGDEVIYDILKELMPADEIKTVGFINPFMFEDWQLQACKEFFDNVE